MPTQRRFTDHALSRENTMCRPDPAQLEALVRTAVAGPGGAVIGRPPPPPGSRRRPLWELDSHAHCPVVGVNRSVSLAAGR